MSKLSIPFVRCLLSSPRALPGLGVVVGMRQPTCGGLCRDTEADRATHLAELHHSVPGSWEATKPEDHYQERTHYCDCGNERPAGWRECVDCKRKHLQYHSFRRQREGIRRSADSVRRAGNRDAAAEQGLCADGCGEQAGVGFRLCLGCRQDRAKKQKELRDKAKAAKVSAT